MPLLLLSMSRPITDLANRELYLKSLANASAHIQMRTEVGEIAVTMKTSLIDCLSTTQSNFDSDKEQKIGV